MRHPNGRLIGSKSEPSVAGQRAAGQQDQGVGIMDISPSLKCTRRTSGGDEISPDVYVITSSMIGRVTCDLDHKVETR